MKDLSKLTVLVFDHGLFLSVARRMAQECKRVLYHSPSEKAFRTLNDSIIGDGYPDIELCEDIWTVMPEVDLVMFSDIQNSGLQLELERQGKLVWASRRGDELEINRQKFLKVLKQEGFPVPTHTILKGLAALREFLKEHEDRFIKISKYRGSLETYHWRNFDLDEHWLDTLSVRFGPAKELIPFLVFDPIEAAIENGCDTYCVDGQWPKTMLNGSEAKDKSYLGSVTAFDDMPENIRDMLTALSPVLKKYRYRNEWSMEMRDKYCIDPTCRGGLPSTGSQLNLWKNFPEIVYQGAQGNLVEPEPAAKFAVECLMTLKCEKQGWGKTRIPKELIPWAKFSGCCEIDGAECFPPTDQHGDEVGWLTAIGNTIEEAIASMMEHAAILPEGLTASTETLCDLLRSIKEGESDGVPFSDQKIPEPASVIDA